MLTPKPPTHWYHLKNDHGTGSILLIGNYTLMALEHVMSALTDELTLHAANPNVHWDLTGIKHMDTAGSAMLWRIWGSNDQQT